MYLMKKIDGKKLDMRVVTINNEKYGCMFDTSSEELFIGLVLVNALGLKPRMLKDGWRS